MNTPQRACRWLQVWIAGYLLLLALVLGGMFWARNRVPELSSSQAKTNWQAWRTSEQNAPPGPARRRVPKSEEPPALVLLRDNFAVLMVGAILFSSLLYWIFAWFITGILTSRA